MGIRKEFELFCKRSFPSLCWAIVDAGIVKVYNALVMFAFVGMEYKFRL